MDLQILEFKIKIKELESTTNRSLKRVINEVETISVKDFVKRVLVIDRISNKELTKIFENLQDLYSGIDPDEEIALCIVQYRFSKGSKDIEGSISSYFRLLGILRRRMKCEDLDTEIFNKCCMVIRDKVTLPYILKEVYNLLKEIMKSDLMYLRYFIENKVYEDFVFFNNFINDFYAHLDDEQMVEVYGLINETYQFELFTRMRSLNPYTILLKGSMMSIPLLYIIYDLNILYEDIGDNYVIKNSVGFIKDLSNFIIESESDSLNKRTDIHQTPILNPLNKKPDELITEEINECQALNGRSNENMIGDSNALSKKQSIFNASENIIHDFNGSDEDPSNYNAEYKKEQNLNVINKECYFKALHGKLEIRRRHKKEVLYLLDNFDKHFENLKNLFDNPFYFLRFSRRTNLTKLGEFISKERNTEYLKLFLTTFDFTDLSLVQAFREFLSSFILPTESQMIIRLLEEFSNKFYIDKNKKEEHPESGRIDHMEIDLSSEVALEPSPNSYACKDVYVIVYSLIMLNTNLYNPTMKIKMNRRVFIENIRKCKISEVFSDAFLESIYCDIKGRSFEYKSVNEYSSGNYKLLRKVESNIRDRKLDIFLRDNRHTKPLAEIEHSICKDCKGKIYKKLFNKYSDLILEKIFRDNIDLNTNEMLSIFVKVSKYFNLHKMNVDLCFHLYQNFDEALFFELFYEIIDSGKNITHPPNAKIDNLEITDFKDYGCEYTTVDIEKNNLELKPEIDLKNLDLSPGVKSELVGDNLKSSSDVSCINELSKVTREVTKGKFIHFFELPFLVLKRKLSAEKNEKLFMFKKDKKNENDDKKFISKFIRIVSSMGDNNFVSFVRQNYRTDSDYLKDILFSVIHKNCFRINLIIDIDLIRFLSHKKSNVKEILDKIIDLDQRNDLYNFLMVYDQFNLTCDDVLLTIIKDHPGIINEAVFQIYRRPFKTDSEKSFNVLLHISRYTPVFDHVCGDFVNNYITLTNSEEYVTIEEIQKRNLELFGKHLTDPNKLINFCMSQIECINYVVMARYTCKKNDCTREMPCPLKDTHFTNKVNKQITYLILKNHLLDNYDLHQYTFYTIQILGRAVPSLVEYFLNNIFILRYIDGITLKTLIKIIITCIKRYKKGGCVCVCASEHKMKERVDRLLDHMMENRYLSQKQIASLDEVNEESVESKEKRNGPGDGLGKGIFEL